MSNAISFDSTVPPPLPFHRFTVQQYHRLGELGLLTAEDRVELLEGWIVKKINQKPAHGFVARLLNDWLQANVPAGYLSQCQLPITTQRSEPEPDLAIVLGAHSDFRDRHPSGSDCRLVIEVADTSVAKDRAKASIYASAGVEEYWIINLVDNQLERMTQSDGSDYQETAMFRPNETIATQIGADTITLSLDGLFA